MLHKYLRLAFVIAFAAAIICAAAPKLSAAEHSKYLKIVVVDVEGGAAALFVTPEGKSLLIDTGWQPGVGGRRPAPGQPAAAPTASSADRIAKAAESLGIKKIDYLLLTHYHADHSGGVESVLQKLPVDTFIDHGLNTEPVDPDPNGPCRIGRSPEKLYETWIASYQGHKHITAQVGQKLNIGSLQLEFVASDGHLIDSPLPGAGAPNALCASVPQDSCTGGEENVRSLGMIMTFGKTRILDLGDLTWNKELELLCPVNKIGKVDVYFVTGHGMNLSSSPPTGALDPLVALMQNGPTKGGDEAVLKTVKSYPDLEGLWQAHFSTRYPDLNPDPNTIANLDQQPDMGYPITLDITPGGEITVTNGRNQFSKTYKARGAKN